MTTAARSRKPGFGAGFLAYGALAAWLIGRPDPEAPDLRCFTELICGQRGLADAILNVAFFIPFGFLLERWGVVRGYRLLVVTPLFSLGLETLQLLQPGRAPSVGDLVFNTMGGITGIMLSTVSGRWSTYRSRTWSWLSAGWAVVLVGVFWMTGFLFQMDLPPSVYWGQWTPTLSHLEPYTGRILNVDIEGLDLPSHQLEQSMEVRRRLRERQTLRVRFVGGRRPSNLSPIFSIADGEEREIVLLGADRDQLVHRMRLRASSWRLHAPDLRVPFPEMIAGDTLTVTVKPKIPTTDISLGDREITFPGFTMGRGWALLLPLPHVGDTARRVLDVFWLALWAVPLGMFVERSIKSGIGVGALVTGLALLPAFWGLASTTLTQWLSMAATFAFGHWLGQRWRRSTRLADPSTP